MITPVKYDKYGSSIELKKLMTKGNMEDDQVNIRIVKIESECAKLKEEAHKDRERIICLEECEDLRDKQMNVLKTFIETYLTVEIDGIKGDHDGKIGVLSIPKAKE